MHAQGGFRPHRHVGVTVFASAGAWVLRRSLVEPSAEIKRFAFGSTLGRVIALEADDRLESGAPGLRIKVVRAEKVSVVGHCDGRHTKTTGLHHQIVESSSTVEHRVLGMYVKMDEFVRCHSDPPPVTVNGDSYRQRDIVQLYARTG